MARMKDLATNRGDAKRRSKKDRSSLKSTFRDLCSTLEVSTLPPVNAGAAFHNSASPYQSRPARPPHVQYQAIWLDEGYH